MEESDNLPVIRSVRVDRSSEPAEPAEAEAPNQSIDNLVNQSIDQLRVHVMAWRSYNALVNNVLLVMDTRSQFAYEAGHVKGSVCVELTNGTLQQVLGPGPPIWAKNCWWGKDVLIVPRSSKKRKTDEPFVDPVIKFLEQESLVRSIKIMEGDEGMDPFLSFAKLYPFLVTKSVKAAKIQSYPAEIVPGLLYLGDIHHASSPSILKDLQINNILTVHTEQLKPYEGFSHLFLDLADEPNGKIASYFDEAFEFIEKAKSSKKRVLVHCGAGASRSSTLCAFYIMKTNKWDSEKTLKFLKNERRQVDPNSGFLIALQEYDQQQKQRQCLSNEFCVEVHKDGEILSRIDMRGKTELFFGRLPTCDVVLDHASISRQHARMWWSGSNWYVGDVGSAHGTFVNNEKVLLSDKREVNEGDLIRFGASSRNYVISRTSQC